MRSTDRLSMAILQGRILRAFGRLRAAVDALNFEQAVLAEQEMNDCLDDLSRRLRVG